ncbi:lyase family protein [Puniceibacterium sediminis]|uniref:3-carboxy-cis,cis-muconate cycloisomerase n=1 Tax=Puniceibacterium sediminis TaxID=1608407 RepID=A0A238YGI7_9RHOB|nr:lyase family protein [Puniceibacterium sediminis]SNR69734.1 3-carboxy-cis,cis-muconate cycloisomerase [Puniceibacterium sediminis]
MTLSPDTIFDRDTLWQSWLDVEAALARAQADLGIIPAWAAEEITAAADLDKLGREELAADVKRTMAPILSLTRLLGRAAGKAGDYVHWGATTQNVMQTGRLLLLREANREIRAHLGRAVARMGALAQEHAGTPMAGRTNRQHALPITFGFKIAGWIEEMERAEARLSDATTRMLALPFGGAVGAMHAFRSQGRALNRRLASDLGLRELLVPGRSANDLFAEYVVQLAMLAMTVERVTSEVYTLMTDEIGEVSEQLDKGTVGSSTMPQKINPKYVVRSISLAAELRSLAAPALETGRSSHEGDSVANHLLSAVLDRAVPLAWRMAESFAETLERLTPNPGRMAENLARSKGAITAENLMMSLAPLVGRAEAHDIVHHVLETGGVSDLSTADEITAHMSPSEIAAALDPALYTGDSEIIAREAARLAIGLSARLGG